MRQIWFDSPKLLEKNVHFSGEITTQFTFVHPGFADDHVFRMRVPGAGPPSATSEETP